MPAPTEKEVLSSLLEALDDSSRSSKNQRFQKWFLGIASASFIVAVVLGYKYFCFSKFVLAFLSGLAGMSLMGFILIQQMKSQTTLLKPYINIQAIESRINELSKT